LDTWIAANLYLSDGRVIRFGHDEIESENIPADISFDTSNPGGFGSASVTLPRPEDLFADDGKLFSHLELYGPGNQIFYEGFVTGVPQVGDNQIQLNLSGWVSALDRHETFRQIFVDRDLGRWNSASRGRRITLNADRTVNDMSVETDNKSGYPALNLELTGPWAAHQWCEAVYDAGVNRVDSLYYDYVTVSAAASQPSSTFDLYLGFADDVEWLNQSLSADQHTVANSTGSGTRTSSSKQRCVVISWRFNGSNTTDGYTYTAMFRNVAVFGNHGLTKRGTAPDQGYYASDIVGYAVQQCPSLTYSSDSIETTSFVIPHLTFTEDTSLRSVIEQVTALGGNQNVANDWGVYEDRTFYWRSPGTYGRTWHVRRDQVATSSSDGPDADRRVAGIKINYCVDDQTECLTKGGWKKHDELTPEDELLAFDPEACDTRWEKPKEIFRNRDYSGPAIQFDGLGGLTTTPDHRWPVRRRVRNGSVPRIEVHTSESLPNEGHILRNAPYADAPTESAYSDAFVRIVAWYLTEGSLLGKNGTRICIAQCPKHNPEKLQSIRDDLATLGAIPNEDGRNGGRRADGLWQNESTIESSGCVCIRIYGKDVDRIIAAAPGKDKVPTMEFLLALTDDQLQMFVDTCIAADGYEAKRIFYQHHKERMDAFTVAAVLAGKCPTLHSDGTGCALNEGRLQGTHLDKLTREVTEYTGTIWCPVTDSGHWVARRNGKVFITGNTDGAGTSLSVGPPGSNSDYETTSLLDSDTDNPAYRIPGAYKSESVGITSQAGAINIGTMILNERNRLDWRGSVTITGEAEDENGNLFPAALIRAGDRIVVSDSGDTTERTIVSTSYDHSSLTTTASIGATPDSLEALLGQLAAVTDLIGT